MGTVSLNNKDVDASLTPHDSGDDTQKTYSPNSKAIYPCTKGANSWSGLYSIISMLEQSTQDALFSDLTDAGADEYILQSYYTKVGGELRSLEEVVASNGGTGSFLILNDVINFSINKERLERSVTKMVPLGRNMSHRTLFSERIGEVSQDFDSKEYVGGAVPLKTYTRPTYPARATAGNGEIAQNVGYGNVAYYDESDIQTIADNFEAMNNNLSHLSISFRGPATIDDLNRVVNIDYILDNVNWDIGRNTTTFSCRSALFN